MENFSTKGLHDLAKLQVLHAKRTLTDKKFE